MTMTMNKMFLAYVVLAIFGFIVFTYAGLPLWASAFGAWSILHVGRKTTARGRH
jgi:hypothetical protein